MDYTIFDASHASQGVTSSRGKQVTECHINLSRFLEGKSGSTRAPAS
jgi:hypothetical protein